MMKYLFHQQNPKRLIFLRLKRGACCVHQSLLTKESARVWKGKKYVAHDYD